MWPRFARRSAPASASSTQLRICLARLDLDISGSLSGSVELGECLSQSLGGSPVCGLLSVPEGGHKQHELCQSELQTLCFICSERR